MGLSIRRPEWDWGSYAGRVIGIAGAYFLLAQLGLSLATVHESVSLVWPPTGLALAVLLVLGARFWPAVALGAFLANALTGAGVIAAAGITLGNTLEAITGVYLLRRLAGFRDTFERPYDAVSFVLLGVGLSPVVAATVGVLSLCLVGQAAWPAYGFLWSAWWLGDATGALVVAPLILAYATRVPSSRSGRTGEAVALMLLLVGVSYGVLGGGIQLGSPGFPFAYAVFPFVIWGALGFGLRGATAATAVISAFAVWATIRGHGPFTAATVTQGLILLQTFVGVVALTGLVLSAALAHRNRIQESMSRLAAIVESSDDAIIGKTPEGVVVSWNRGAERIYGHTAEEMVGKPISVLVPPQRLQELNEVLERARGGEHIRHHETVRVRKDGSWIHVSLSIWPMQDRAGKVVGLSTVARDVSEQRAAEAALEQANAELTRWVNDLEEQTRQASLLSEMGDLLQSCRTSEEAYAVVTRFAERLLPGSAGMLGLLNESKGTVEVVALWSRNPGLMAVEAFGPDQCWALRRGRPHAVGGGESALLCGHLHPSPRTPYVCVPMMAAGHPLGVLHVQPAPRDPRRELTRAADAVEALQRLAESVAGQVALTLANLRLQETLRGQAIHDPLTGLFNRRYMEESLDRELQRADRSGAPLGLILMDIDHFKGFNDSYGHEVGDLLLAALGNLLRTLVREEDIVCRYGGEEFTVLLPEASLKATLQRAEEIRDGVRHLTVPSERGTLGSITVSLGVAGYPEHGLSSRELLAAADAALYRAKEEGRDRPAVAAPASGRG